MCCYGEDRSGCGEWFFSRWRYWIQPVVMLLYAAVVLVLIPFLIVAMINGNYNPKDQAILIGGIFVFLALPISFWGITQHLIHYTKPYLQKHIIRLGGEMEIVLIFEEQIF